MSISKRAATGPGPGRATLLALCLLPIACGGKVVVDGAGGGTLKGDQGGGGATNSSVAVSSADVTSSTSVDASSSVASTGVGGAPKIPPLIEVPYGNLPSTAQIAVDIPAGMLGFTAVATTANPQSTIGFETLTAPDGAAIVTDYGMPATYAGYYGYGIAAVAVPQTSQPEAMPVQAGSWQLTLGDGGGPSPGGDVTVWIRQTLDGKFHGGMIDVNLFVVAGVADEPYMIDKIHTAFDEYAGLTVDTINVFPLDDSFFEVNDANFYEGLEKTQGAPGKPALNVLAIGYLSGSLEGAAGVTPGAPAMPLYHGTHLSGFYWMVLQDDFFDPVILKHETGHLSGLFHTSEFEPGLGDALSDTPFCDDVMAQGGGCPDFDNLMFPTGGDGSLTLTDQQLRVIQGSVLYRGIVEEGGGPALPLDQSKDGTGNEAIPSPSRSPSARTFAALVAPPARASWAHGLPRGLVDHLVGVGCPSGHAGYYETLQALGGDDAATLLSIGTDSNAPAHVRMRALVAAGRASPSEPEIALLSAIAESPASPRAVRIGAVRGVGAASRTESLALAGRLGSDPERAVARMAASTAGLRR